jgi:hypothetical protein
MLATFLLLLLGKSNDKELEAKSCEKRGGIKQLKRANGSTYVRSSLKSIGGKTHRKLSQVFAFIIYVRNIESIGYIQNPSVTCRCRRR